jgi:hypothetical protein
MPLSPGRIPPAGSERTPGTQALGERADIDSEKAVSQPFDDIAVFDRLRIGAVIAVAAALVFGVWLVLRNDDGASKGKRSEPESASVGELRDLARSAGHPVYWAGTPKGYTYELTRNAKGEIYIRYLPVGVPVGDKRPDFLAIGTYPHPGAFGTAQKAAKRPGEFVRKLPGGGLAVSGKELPGSVYLAYPGTDYLIEVYDPSPARARRLVLSGRVRPIG